MLNIAFHTACHAIPLAANGAVEFSRVGYRYAKGGGGLSEATMLIHPGDFLGITGPSSAGKTTFADLLVGLIAPQRGIIKVGDIVPEGEARKAWRRHIGYVVQGPFLYPRHYPPKPFVGQRQRHGGRPVAST